MSKQCKATGAANEASARRMSRDLRKSKDQQERIFEAIAKLMVSTSPDALTMDAISARIGGSKGTVYYYFKSKGEMFYRMQMYGHQLMSSAVFPVMDDRSIPPLERLERVIRAQVLVVCKHWQLFRAIQTDLALRVAPSNLAAVARRSRGVYQRRLTELVEEVVEAQAWRCIHPKVAAFLISDAATNFSRWYEQNGRLSDTQMADIIVQTCLYGPFQSSQIGLREQGTTTRGDVVVEALRTSS